MGFSVVRNRMGLSQLGATSSIMRWFYSKVNRKSFSNDFGMKKH